MGELGNAEKASILRGFTARAASLATPTAQRTWRWANGTVLFPEGICPYCKATMNSNRIWMLGTQTLQGQVRIQPPAEGESVGRLVREKPEHPHVQGTNICMGSSNSVESALFLGITPGDTFWGRGGGDVLKNWLRKMFGHVCGRPDVGDLVYTTCPVCLTSLVEGEPHTARSCSYMPCACSCQCNPASWGACTCGHAECRCTERRQLARTHTYPGTQVDCSHSCCRDCCVSAGCDYGGEY